MIQYRPNLNSKTYFQPVSLQNPITIRHACPSFSTNPLPLKRGPVFRFFYRFFAYSGAFILVSGGLVIAFFIYDASTYREDLSYTDIPVSESALKPKRGGPKNLPIAEVLVDDDDCDEMARQKYKPKLVVIGSGWGSVALLKTLNPEDYHVTVVSDVNYFLFTPMLPSATVGTLELRSLVEPIRRIVQRVRGHFLKAEAVDVELSEQLLEVAQTDLNGVKRHFYLPYDKLVIAVGGQTRNVKL
jgi:NADH dehydrogenase